MRVTGSEAIITGSDGTGEDVRDAVAVDTDATGEVEETGPFRIYLGAAPGVFRCPDSRRILGRYDIAANILRTYASFVDRGMLPNRFPDGGEAPEYNTADATLWMFHALDDYLQARAGSGTAARSVSDPDRRSFTRMWTARASEFSVDDE